MGSLEDYAIEIGVERGTEKTMLKNITNLMENLSVSAEEAFRLLKVPETEWTELRTKLAAREQTPPGDSAR